MKKVCRITNKQKLTAVLLFLIASVCSCSKWDEFKNYTASGEIIYPGKLDSVKAYSGKYRVRITGKMNADPKISGVKIFWNKNEDSLVYEIKRGVTGNVFDQTFSIAESITTFTVYTYDTDGNKSVPVYVVGKSLGDAYRRSLTNRFITSLAYTSANDSTTINWDVALATVQYTEIKYPKNPGGNMEMVAVSPKDTKTGLKGFNYQTASFSYRTYYLPDSTCIDTFATQYVVR